MIIEKLQVKDINEYKELIDECFESSNNIEQYINGYDYNSEDYTVLVSKIDNKIVGSITFYKINLFTYSFQPVIEIFNVAVLKEYRGQSIAKTIFENIINYAKENNYKSINLTCLDTAYNAHKLYESVGFKKASSVKFNLYLDSK